MKSAILHITPTVGQGGAERVLSNLLRQQEHLIDHHVLSLLPEEPFFPIPCANFDSLRISRRFFSPRALYHLRESVKRLKPSLIHAWLYHGNFSSIFVADFGIPILWSIHNTTLSPTQSKRTTRLINRLCAALSNRIPARIVYCSASARNVHEQLGYQPSRGIVIENGIDLEAFRYDAGDRIRLRLRLGIRDDEFLIGCIARFEAQKNHRLVIDAFTRVAREVSARLILAGNGCTPDNIQLQSWLREFEIQNRVLLVGEQRDVSTLLSGLDALVIGSSFGEALPLVAIEAAASGLPLVATNVGDVASFVLDPMDLIPVDSPADMTAALLRVRERYRWGGLAHRSTRVRDELLKTFSIEVMSQRYWELYQTLGPSSSS